MHIDSVVFLDVDDVHGCHTDVLQLGGGLDGVRDLGVIQSATMAPRSGYYATLGELAAVYVHGLAKNHGYVDGNKRTAAHVLMAFLGANGFPVILADEWIRILEGVADGSITRHRLTDMIVARLLGGVDVPIDP